MGWFGNDKPKSPYGTVDLGGSNQNSKAKASTAADKLGNGAAGKARDVIRENADRRKKMLEDF